MKAKEWDLIPPSAFFLPPFFSAPIPPRRIHDRFGVSHFLAPPVNRNLLRLSGDPRENQPVF